MKSIFKRVLLSAVGMLSAVAFYGQNIEVDYSKYPDANPFAKGVVKSSEKKTEGGVARSSIYGSTRPDHVNNALRKFFPPVFFLCCRTASAPKFANYPVSLASF